MLIGAFVALRFIGQLMMTKRNLDEEKRIKQADKKFRKEKEEKYKSFGKTTIISNSKVKGDVKDVDHEEL